MAKLGFKPIASVLSEKKQSSGLCSLFFFFNLRRFIAAGQEQGEGSGGQEEKEGKRMFTL